MNKERFIKELQSAIAKLPKEEQMEILQDYEEYFQMGQLDGKDEEEMTASLGNPKLIGKELVATYQIEEVEKNTSIGNFLKATWMVIGLGFFNLIIVLGPFLVIASLLLASWSVGVGFAAAPIVMLVNVAIYPEIFQLFDLFNSFVLCGLGLFIIIASYGMTKVCMRGFIRYLKYNTKLVKGGLEHA
ncbi:HAAS signaling domain-containing protein [Pseudogracilibacillus sp. ICA-222130]|uniref:HAAS signaling domain-containing protein n=1 Tax=Pseudogracilibacillus sp. ICA-222130 TaxID=3134655 RepID=UPI0030C0D1AB